MIKILITGGAGYIGSSLNNYLSEYKYFEIESVNRRHFDLTNSKQTYEFFSNTYYDVVIHCAVMGGSRLKVDTWKDCDSNLTMYYNLLQCRDHYGKMIHFGSGAELYASNRPYGFSKSVIRKSILNREGFYNIRIFGVFDENELDTRFIKSNINRYIKGEDIVIHKDKAMDMFYMRDLVKIVDHYIRNENLPKEIDCTYAQTKKLTEIANIINQLSDHNSNIVLQSMETDQDYKGKHTDLALDFVGLEEGIKTVYQKLK